MSASLTWAGLAELDEAFQNLPAALAAEADALVTRRGEAAVQTIGAGYPSRTKDLKSKLRGALQRSGVSVQYVITNTSKHASWFENGTQARHTKLGADRGSMPAHPLFIPTMRRSRRALTEDLRALLVRAGLTVTGGDA